MLWVEYIIYIPDLWLIINHPLTFTNCPSYSLHHSWILIMLSFSKGTAKESLRNKKHYIYHHHQLIIMKGWLQYMTKFKCANWIGMWTLLLLKYILKWSRKLIKKGKVIKSVILRHCNICTFPIIISNIMKGTI
jgi:hypothetical protein